MLVAQGGAGVQNAPAPPPTKVGKSPHASVTVNVTVVACPAARLTRKVAEAVLAGSDVRCPGPTGPLPTTSTLALACWPQVIAWSALPNPGLLAADTVTRNRPSPFGTAWV